MASLSATCKTNLPCMTTPTIATCSLQRSHLSDQICTQSYPSAQKGRRSAVYHKEGVEEPVHGQPGYLQEGAMYLTSRAFKNGSRIPPQYTQDGQGAKVNISPPLEWYNVPEETVCLVLILEDPEPMMENSPNVFCHWIVLNIPPTLKGLPENFSTKEHDDDSDELTQIREGINDFKVYSYHGPNPPVGEHNYEFHLYALDAFPRVPKRPARDRLLEGMKGHILAEAVLMGHYHKEQYGTEDVKGYHPKGLPQRSGPGRAQVKIQHLKVNNRVNTIAHQ